MPKVFNFLTDILITPTSTKRRRYRCFRSFYAISPSKLNISQLEADVCKTIASPLIWLSVCHSSTPQSLISTLLKLCALQRNLSHPVYLKLVFEFHMEIRLDRAFLPSELVNFSIFLICSGLVFSNIRSKIHFYKSSYYGAVVNH